MSTYHIEAAQLPQIMIIDPRTGARVATIRGYVSAEVLLTNLSEFLDNNSFNNQIRPKGRELQMSEGALEAFTKRRAVETPLPSPTAASVTVDSFRKPCFSANSWAPVPERTWCFSFNKSFETRIGFLISSILITPENFCNAPFQPRHSRHLNSKVSGKNIRG